MLQLYENNSQLKEVTAVNIGGSESQRVQLKILNERHSEELANNTETTSSFPYS
ncbi:MAG: hypothetical protein ACX932_06775 [Gammaproteobacteria bacterium]